MSWIGRIKYEKKWKSPSLDDLFKVDTPKTFWLSKADRNLLVHWVFFDSSVVDVRWSQRSFLEEEFTEWWTWLAEQIPVIIEMQIFPHLQILGVCVFLNDFSKAILN